MLYLHQLKILSTGAVRSNRCVNDAPGRQGTKTKYQSSFLSYSFSKCNTFSFGFSFSKLGQKVIRS